MRFPSLSRRKAPLEEQAPSRRGKWLVLVAAVVFGLFAAMTANFYLKKRIDALKADTVEMAEVVVAKEGLPRGARLSFEGVALRQIPKDYVLSSAITPEQFSRAEHAELRVPAAAGEQIVWSQLESGEGASFSARIEVGRRAVTIPVDDISSVSGMLVPGDAIDIVVGLHKGNRTISLPLLQRVKVLATGRMVSRDERTEDGRKGEYTTVTLDVSPFDAQRVLLAREVGKISALLRHPEDLRDSSIAQLDSSALTGGEPRRASPEVPVIVGGSSMADAQLLSDFRAMLRGTQPPTASVATTQP